MTFQSPDRFRQYPVPSRFQKNIRFICRGSIDKAAVKPRQIPSAQYRNVFADPLRKKKLPLSKNKVRASFFKRVLYIFGNSDKMRILIGRKQNFCHLSLYKITPLIFLNPPYNLGPIITLSKSPSAVGKNKHRGYALIALSR